MHAQDGHARYVDTAEYQHEGYVTVAVKASTGTETTTASVRCTDVTDAITLATSEAECRTVLCD